MSWRPWQRGRLRAADFCPGDGNLDGMLSRVEKRTGRPISVVHKALPRGGPSGVWIAAEKRDVIVLDEHSTAVRRETALCHELGHILLDHGKGQPLADLGLFPDLHPDLVRRSMQRGGYADREEAEAERFATELFQALRGARAKSKNATSSRFH